MTCCNEIGNVLMFQVFPNQTLLQHIKNKIIISMQNLMNNQQTKPKGNEDNIDFKNATIRVALLNDFYLQSIGFYHSRIFMK